MDDLGWRVATLPAEIPTDGGDARARRTIADAADIRAFERVLLTRVGAKDDREDDEEEDGEDEDAGANLVGELAPLNLDGARDADAVVEGECGGLGRRDGRYLDTCRGGYDHRTFHCGFRSRRGFHGGRRLDLGLDVLWRRRPSNAGHLVLGPNGIVAADRGAVSAEVHAAPAPRCA